jgi:protein-tyrosine-phosphatase/predicted ATP-grasp superfamily ATP-dependent carboligase
MPSVLREAAGFNVLILDGHSSAALECAQSLGRRGAQVSVACESGECLAFHSRYVSERLKQPPPIPAGPAHAWLRQQQRQHAFDLILPSTDVSIELMRILDEDDPLRRVAVLPGNAALDRALDKHATYEAAQALGIPLPACELIERGAAIPSWNHYPVVLKSTRSRVPINGESRRMSAVVARGPADRRKVLERWLPYVSVQQEEFVSGHGFGIEMLFDRGRLAWYFAHERLHEFPLTGGGSTYRRSIAPPAELLEMAERLLRALEWHGVAMVEFRGSLAGPFYLMEINPRLWGSLALSIDSGVDFPWGLATLARGQEVPPHSPYRIGYYTRNIIHDENWHLDNLRADRNDPLLLTQPRLLAAIQLLRPLLGRESWDYFDWHDMGVTRQMLRVLVRRQVRHVTNFARRRWAKHAALLHHRRVTAAQERKGRPVRLLFVCHGNICRSPLAMHLARRRLKGVDVMSAGFHDTEGRPSPANVCRAAVASGLDLTTHASRRLTAVDLAGSDLVLCMDIENLQALRREFPEALERSTLMGFFATPPRPEIADPYALSDSETEEVLALIASGIEGLHAWIKSVPLCGVGTGGRVVSKV